MKRLNDLYDYGLKIYQDADYFKFSLDSILLAEYIKLHKSDRVIDLCTGNAPIPMILSTKYINQIYGVELQEEIYNNAISSLEYNKLSDQIKIINDNVTNLNNYFPGNKFDVITCNPPYFRYNGKSLVNKDEKKSISRHEIYLNLPDLVKTMDYLLNDSGQIYMVYTAQRLMELSSELNKYNIYIKEVYCIITNKTNEISIVLIKAVKNSKSDVKIKYLDVRDLKTYKNIKW